MSLPPNCDSEKLAEVAIALLYVTMHESGPGWRAWKGVDWDLMNLLHEKGWISDPPIENKSDIGR